MRMRFSLVVGLMLFTGCASIIVTSDPPGAHVYNACGPRECGTIFRGFRPYDNVQGTYRGVTPVAYGAGFFAYDNVRVVWPDGEDSGWRQRPTPLLMQSTFSFVKRNKAASPAEIRNPTSSAAQSIAVTAPQEDTKPTTISQSDNGPRSAVVVGEEQIDQAIVAPKTAPIAKSRFVIRASIEDDPAKGDAILGNGDGHIQKGEAFDLVVVVTNASTSTAAAVTCTVTLPSNKSLIAFSELQFAVAELAPAAATTNRINLAMPLSVTITKALVCSIEVNDIETNAIERLEYELPMDLW